MGSNCQNGLIWLKFDSNDQDNIVNRLYFQGHPRSKVNLRSDFHIVPIGLKLNMNNPNNILNRLNLLSRSSKVKGQFGVRFSKCSDLAQI